MRVVHREKNVLVECDYGLRRATVVSCPTGCPHLYLINNHAVCGLRIAMQYANSIEGRRGKR